MLIWPEASSAKNNIAAVSADGSTVYVLNVRLNRIEPVVEKINSRLGRKLRRIGIRDILY